MDSGYLRRRNPGVVFGLFKNIWSDQIKRYKYLVWLKLKATNIRSDQEAQIFGVTSGEEILGWQSPSKQLPTWVVDQAPENIWNIWKHLKTFEISESTWKYLEYLKTLENIWNIWKHLKSSCNQFYNGANPSMVLLLEQNVQPTQIQNINCSWGQKHKFPFICGLGFSFLHPQILMVCNG